MIEIKGDSTKIQGYMKTLRAEAMKQIRALEKKEKKEDYLKAADRNRYDVLQKQLPMYSVTQTLPVQVDGIIINGKLLQKFLKKLKGMHYKIFTQGEMLCVHYGLKPSEYTGELKLYDLSTYFNDFPDVPRLVINHES